MFADFLSSVFEFYNHIELIVYEVIKNRQNNHIIPLYFYSKQIFFLYTYHSLFNIMLVKDPIPFSGLRLVLFTFSFVKVDDHR